MLHSRGMADNVINLNQFRKARARAESEKQAEQNRVKFGRTKAEKNVAKAEKAREDKAHDALRRDPTDKPE